MHIKDHRLSFGTAMLTPDILDGLVKEAITTGYTLIDTAYIYGNETEVYKAYLKNKDLAPGVEYQTKMWTGHFHRAEEAFNETLQRLGAKKLYSYMLHRPAWDYWANIKAWRVLVAKHKAGLIDYIGVSNFDKDLIEDLYKDTGMYPHFNQMELSVVAWRGDRVKYAKEHNIHLQAYSVLQGNNLHDPKVNEIAKIHNTSAGNIAIAFVMAHGFTAITRSSKIERVKDGSKSLKVKLTNEEINQLRERNQNDNMFAESFEWLPDEKGNYIEKKLI